MGDVGRWDEDVGALKGCLIRRRGKVSKKSW